MLDTVSFVQVLEAADKLSLSGQETLVEILRRRMIEHRREELAKDVRDALQEHGQGSCRPTTPEQLMGEVRS